MAMKQASATFVEPTGQMRYVLTWDSPGVILMSGTNLNDGTEWVGNRPVWEPDRFGPTRTPSEFFAWVSQFTTF